MREKLRFDHMNRVAPARLQVIVRDTLPVVIAADENIPKSKREKVNEYSSTPDEQSSWVRETTTRCKREVKFPRIS